MKIIRFIAAMMVCLSAGLLINAVFSYTYVVKVVTYYSLWFHVIMFLVVSSLMSAIFALTFKQTFYDERCKLMAQTLFGFVLAWWVLPFFSFTLFGFYLGGVPSWFGGIPSKNQQNQIYSMTIDGKTVQPKDYIPTLNAISLQYKQEREKNKLNESFV